MAIGLKTRLLAAATLTGLVGVAHAAQAQTSVQETAPAAELGEIIVTAQLREQDPSS